MIPVTPHLVALMLNARLETMQHHANVFPVLREILTLNVNLSVQSIRNVPAISLVYNKNVEIHAQEYVVFMPPVLLTITIQTVNVTLVTLGIPSMFAIERPLVRYPMF